MLRQLNCFKVSTLFCVFLVIIIFLFIQDAYSNGAVWNPGNVPGTPGPVKQNDLILLKESVLFDDDPDANERSVTAEFWIYNPTDKEINVTMGFPLDYEENYKASPDFEMRRQAYIKAFAKDFVVTSNDNEIIAVPLKSKPGPYTVVFTWDMSFPAMKTTKFTVEYPLKVSEKGEDEELGSSHGGSEYSRSFKYITHTGAYWAKPIHKATFEYCSDSLVKFMLRVPSGETTNDQSTRTLYSTSTDGWSVQPKPYEINAEKSCIVWTRENWQPKKQIDDIKVSTYSRSYSEEREELNPDMLLRNWCGISSYGDKAPHLAEYLNITEKKITSEMYYSIRQIAYFYPANKMNKQFDEKASEVPAGIGNAYQSLLLWYLRNYIFAVHGHVFKDQQLAQCFQNVTKSASIQLSGVEKWNVDWLLDYEKQLKK